MENNNLYQLDGKVNILKALPFGLQHVLAMFVSNITPIIILAGVIGLDSDLSAILIQNCMIIAGIGTIVQLFFASRLPIVMGISFTFLSLSIGIASTMGMNVLIGAVIIGGIFEGVLGLFAKYWLKIISPVVAATVVIGIGFSLLPIGANSFAGGQGAADFGAANNWIVGTITLLVCLVFQVFAKGTWRSLAVLIGLVVGYIVALCMGMVDFTSFSQHASGFPVKILPFKPEFNIGAILSIIAIYCVSATETIGDASALASGALGRDANKRELSGAIACDGFVSSLSGIFGCTPITSFSQNVGLAAMTKVVNRIAIATGAVVMIVAGFIPPVGKALTTIPQAVLGGCTIMMFGSILFAGMKMLGNCGFSQRNMVIVSLALSIGLGFTAASDMFNIFPEIIRTIFAQNCVAVVFIMAVVLNLILPKEEKEEAAR